MSESSKVPHDHQKETLNLINIIFRFLPSLELFDIYMSHNIPVKAYP